MPKAYAYNAGTNTLSMTGGTEADPITFQNLYDWDQTQGPLGKVKRLNANEFELNCLLTVGDGSTSTYFGDSNRMVVISNVATSPWSVNPYLTVMNNATFRLGTLVNDTDKSTSDGCFLIFTDPYQIGFNSSGGVQRYYGLNLRVNAQFNFGGWSDTVLYNCTMHANVSVMTSGNTTLYNILLLGGSLLANVGTNTDRITKLGAGTILQTPGSAITIRNYTAKGATALAWWSGWGGQIYLIDPDFNTWGGSVGGYDSRDAIYRQYSFNLNAVDSGNNPIENLRVVVLDKDGNALCNVLTGSGGSITEQAINHTRYKSTPVYGVTDVFEYFPHVQIFRKYGFKFQRLQSTIAAPTRIPFVATTNSFVTLSEANAGALTGVSVDGANKTITVSGTRTLSELYDYTQYWSVQSGNMIYDEPITTVDGTTLTLASGWSLGVTGSLTSTTKNISGTVTVSSGGFYEDTNGAKWDVSGTTYYAKHVYRNVKDSATSTNQQYAVVACWDSLGNDRTYNTSRTNGGLVTDANGNVEGYYVYQIGATTYTLVEYIGLYGFLWSLVPIASVGTAIGVAGAYDTIRLAVDPYVTLTRVNALAVGSITVSHASKYADLGSHTLTDAQDYLKAIQASTSNIEAGKPGYKSYHDVGWILSNNGVVYSLLSDWRVKHSGDTQTLKSGTLELDTPGTVNDPINTLKIDCVTTGTYDLRGAPISGTIHIDSSNNQTVTVQLVPGTSYVNDNPTYVTVEASASVQIVITNIVSGSRLQLYNLTDATQLCNLIVNDTSYSMNLSYSADKDIRVRLAYVNGVTAKLFYENQGTLTAAGMNMRVSQVDDDIYNAVGIDGSTVSECSISGTNIEININDPDNTTSAQRIYAFECYWLFTQYGIADQNLYIEAIDATHYKFLGGLRLRNLKSTPLNILGANIVPETGPASDVYDPAGGPIFLNYERVEGFAYSSGSGLSPEEHNKLMGLTSAYAWQRTA